MAIISDINDIIRNTNTRIQIQKNDLLPLIPAVRTQIINRYIPSELYEFIDSLSGSMSVIETEMLNRLRASLANLLIAFYIPRSELTIGQDGLQRTENDNSKSAYKYQISSMYKSYYDAGLMHFEEFLKFIEQNKSDIPLWNDSDFQKKYNELHIKSGTELLDYLQVKHPCMVFSNIRNIIYEVQVLTMPNLFSNYYSLIFDTDDDTDLFVLLRGYMKRIIALLSIHYSIPRHMVAIDADGFVSASNDNYIDGKPADKDNQISMFIENLEKNIKAWVDKVNEIIKENPDHFPVIDEKEKSYNAIDNSHFTSLFSF